MYNFIEAARLLLKRSDIDTNVVSATFGFTAQVTAQCYGHKELARMIDETVLKRNNRQRLQTFLMGTRLHMKFSVAVLPIDVIGMIVKQTLEKKM